MDDNILLKLYDAGLKIKRLDKLKNINLDIRRGEFIGIYGLNGSGKSLLAEVLGGEIKTDSGSVIYKPELSVSVVSSAERKRMLDEDRHNDDSEFMEGRIDPGRSVADIIRLSAGSNVTADEADEIIDTFGIRHILNRGIKFLSTGEFRKMMIVRAILAEPDIIVLDDPFTGLDIDTRRLLEGRIDKIRISVGALVLISGRLDDLRMTDSLYFLYDCSLTKTTADEIRGVLNSELPKITDFAMPAEKESSGTEKLQLVAMSGVKMHYYDEIILSDINWVVNAGEHWQITGPNGSGKSSLLSLITGDSPKAYGQDINLFGRKRGSGETIWDIKKRIGYVSGSLQREHRISQNVLSVVVSGFFDSIGLYDKPDPVQVEKARGWCEEFGIESVLESAFDSLSEGMKRAVLIIRAVVKRPELLILDEPCQGLDDYNSDFVLAVARRVIKRDHSTLLYVSHDPRYRMKEIDRFLELVPHGDGGFTAAVRRW